MFLSWDLFHLKTSQERISLKTECPAAFSSFKCENIALSIFRGPELHIGQNTWFHVCWKKKEQPVQKRVDYIVMSNQCFGRKKNT